MEEKKHTTVSIPTPLAKKVQERIEGTGFTSLSSYVTYILRQIITETQEEKKEAFSKDDEEKVKARLKGLGYF